MTIPDCIDKKVCVTLDAEEKEQPFEKTYSLHGGVPLRLGQTSGQIINGAMTIDIEDLVKITGHINYLKTLSCEYLIGKDLSGVDCIATSQAGDIPHFTYIPTDKVYLHERFFEKQVLFVTAFKNIRRDTWGPWGVPIEEYFARYEHLKKAVSPLVCFSDEVEGALPFEAHNTFFTLIERDRECMESETYKKHLNFRIENPEHCRPEYTSITHTKVNFIARAARMFPGYTHYIWIDFGYFRSADTIPDQWLLAPLLGKRIHFALFGELPFLASPKEICQSTSDFIQGGLFTVPRELTDWIEIQYRRSLDTFYHAGFADDEQAIFLHIQARFPKIFEFHKINEWFGIRKLYSLKK
jgi:hypothetical protein